MKTVKWYHVMIVGIILSLFWIITFFIYQFSHSTTDFEQIAQFYDDDNYRWRTVQHPIYITERNDVLNFCTDTKEYEHAANQNVDAKLYLPNASITFMQSLDYDKYDYIILCNGILERIVHAPFLSSRMQKEMWGRKASYIPFYYMYDIDSLFVYRIKK